MQQINRVSLLTRYYITGSGTEQPADPQNMRAGDRWGDPLRIAWDEGLRYLRQHESDLPPTVVPAIEAVLQRADNWLSVIGILRAMVPSTPMLDVRRLAQDTLEGLTSMTRRLLAERDLPGLASWLMAQEGQLKARLDSWLEGASDWTKVSEASVTASVKVSYSGTVYSDTSSLVA